MCLELRRGIFDASSSSLSRLEEKIIALCFKPVPIETGAKKPAFTVMFSNKHEKFYW